jgi:hypothetical protein
VIPILLLLAFAVLAVARVSHAQLGVGSAAREAARAAALAPTRESALVHGRDRGVETGRGYGLTNGSLDLTLDATAFGRGGQVRATARYEVPLADLPLLGWARVPLQESHVEWIDPYRSWPGGERR